MPTAIKQFTVRVPGALYDEARTLARKRGTSLNQLAATGLSELARKDREEQLRLAYELLATNPDEMDVEPFLPAQTEAVSDDRR
jgi:hypothetical protein